MGHVPCVFHALPIVKDEDGNACGPVDLNRPAFVLVLGQFPAWASLRARSPVIMLDKSET